MAGSASRTVTLNVIGNASGATKALNDVAGQSEGAAKRASAAFGGVLSTLNSTGVLGPFGEAISRIGDSFDSISLKAKDLGKTMMGLGAAGVGVGGILAAAAGPDQAALQQLKQTISTTGGSYDDFKDRIESTITANEKFGTTANKTQDAIRILTQATGDTGKAIDLMGTASNLAAAKHEDLATAATDLVKVYEGKGTKILTQFGLATQNTTTASKDLTTATKAAQTADDNLSSAKQKLADLQEIQSTKTKLTVSDQIALRNAEQAVTDDTNKATDAHKKLGDAQTAAGSAAKDQSQVLSELSGKLNGQAAAASDTFAGHMKALRAEIEDGAAKIGAKYGPALTGLSAGVTLVGGVVETASGVFKKFSDAQKVAKDGQEALTAAETASEGPTLASMGPILLVVAAVAALGVGIYELWTHWSQIWGWIKNVAADAYNWIKDHITLILTVALGPLGFAIGELATHWSTVWNGMKGVISDVWNFMSPVFELIKRAIHDISGPLGDVVGAVSKVGGVLGGAISHLPGFASGGSIAAGQLSIVGENGPELFLPGSSGTIVPNGQFGGGMNASITINAAPGMDPAAIARAVRDEMLRMKRRNVNGGLS